MSTDNIASTVHKFSERNWPNQMLIARVATSLYRNKIEIKDSDKEEWEATDPDLRVSLISDCIGLLSCEIDRIEHTIASSKSIDDIMIGIHGKEMVEKMKSDTPLIYNAMCSGMKSYASQKCTEQRRNVLNSLTATPFFIKYRAEFPRSLVLSAPEPKL